MTATPTSAPWLTKLTRGERVFAGGVLIGALHLLNAAVHGDGRAGALVLAAFGLAPALLAMFLRGGRAARAVLAAAVGVAAFADGLVLHLPHAVLHGASATDLTGIPLLVAGLTLVVLAFRIALAGTRRSTKLLAVPVCLIALQWLLVPLITAAVVVNGPADDAGSARSLGLAGARDVSFPARDGTPLTGWYVPGRNGAAVIALHGSHGTRASATDALRVLHRAGYAVLSYDARGHGRSAGQTNALGWRGADDVAGAVTFLTRGTGVDPRRIGALGLSMGGEEALRAAADGVALRAVIADGAGASTGRDGALVHRGALQRSVSWTTMRAVELFSGDREPSALIDRVADIRVPVLLIASNRAGERRIDEELRRRIGARAALWYVSDAGHTQAQHRHPAAYANRILGFFATSLSATTPHR